MLLILGLIILVVAAIVGLVGIFGNFGASNSLTAGGDFSVFGYHATGSTGSLFLTGIIVGAVAALGLALVMLGARRSASARRERRASRREPAVGDRERDDPINERDTAGAATDSPAAEPPRRHGRWFGHRPSPR
ncbi:hypothetical protein ACFV4Q_34760 [Streptomyces nojiriensis]|uniref:hypothetical protein n=1 Tax=Streptomyces nojiriensis TaxID=66374 RepID=UPI00364B38AF